MQKKKRSKLWLVILILVMAVSGGWLWWASINSPVDVNAPVKAFVVTEGESTDKIVARLESEGIIRSGMAFKIFLKTSSSATSIQAGTFKLSGAMTYDELMKNLSSGVVDKWVTLLEGWRVEQVAKQLKAELGIDSNAFLKSAREGYMFPDTYLFNKEVTPADIVSTLQNTFDKRYSQDIQDQVKARGLSPEQGVILASIVEREARSDGERQRVASILLKRIKIGMKLDADATVQYAKDSIAYKNGTLTKYWQPVTRDDYHDTLSPYNTYTNNGLPPGPICNPSLSSLKAVANATDTPYLYYYHDSAGRSYYATTLEEHNENVANYR